MLNSLRALHLFFKSTEPFHNLLQTLGLPRCGTVIINQSDVKKSVALDPIEYIVSLDAQRNTLHFWLDDQIILCPKAVQHEVTHLTKSEAKLFVELLERGEKGAGCSQLHKILEPKLTYTESRHRSRLSGELSRLRKHLAPLHLLVLWDREKKVYSIKNHQLVQRVHVLPNETIEVTKLTDIQFKILDLLKNQDKISMVQLRTELGNMSRQRLHPHLKKLALEGHVTLHFRGRSTFYRISGKATLAKSAQ
jgi:DNA-binding transcriptional ArsR family regulator